MEAWKRYIRRDDSHLVDLFVGQLKSTLRCTHCNHESVTFEPFWDLSLGIPARTGDVSLNECFDVYSTSLNTPCTSPCPRIGLQWGMEKKISDL